MKTRLALCSMLFAVAVCLSATTIHAATSYTPILHSEYQAVNDDDGTNAWPLSGIEPYSISLVGVVINTPKNMIDYTQYSASGFSGTQWQVFIQATEAGDFGGTALYMQVNSKDPNPTLYPSYSESQWNAAMDALNRPLLGGVQVPLDEPLRCGDKVLVEANAPGLFYGGKYNVNEKHSTNPNYNFTITILERNTTPQVAQITLADLKSTAAGTFDQFIFDGTRATGCEHYQASLVHLDNLRLLSGTWAKNGTVMVGQTVKIGDDFVDLTFPLKLGLDDALFTDQVKADVAGGLFSLTAILDQEDTSSPGNPYNGSPFIDNYRLWLTEGSNFFPVPEPSSLILLAAALMGLGWYCRRKK